ncbi:LuxR C-terminal-related transcriptional regulator [Pantoea coffeiphila]|uniref:LuxR C-terminal-related transcriptional regulator n=1 Tax=Pantoea coffeiphila TaxID=1465635 RepID=UPI00196092F1|nr:response regulator transcription factor [Pantoea coffeiphila]MBM7344116.1 two-component system capsular synthesis response regulator RcsB [Pantoea coffeiphila]
MANLKSFSALQLLLEIGDVDIVFTELYDSGMDIITGIEFIRNNRHHWRKVKLIILTSVEEPGLVKYLTGMGAQCYFSKRDDITAIISGLNQQDRIQSVVSPRLDTQTNSENAYRTPLTMAELNVAWLLARNNTVITISKQMNVSYKTIHTHKTNLMKKLNIADMPQLMKYLSVQHHSF